jgi:hypothetical protein
MTIINGQSVSLLFSYIECILIRFDETKYAARIIWFGCNKICILLQVQTAFLRRFQKKTTRLSPTNFCNIFQHNQYRKEP